MILFLDSEFTDFNEPSPDVTSLALVREDGEHGQA